MTRKTNRVAKLATLGQALWLDDIQRDLLTSGALARMIEEDGLRGMTSNPAIFQHALASSHAYESDIKFLVQGGNDPMRIYEVLSQRDVQCAADLFRALYDRTDGLDGYVSLEVNPHLAHDTEGTLQEARRLWLALDRPNVFIKVPATAQGLPAIRQLLSEGVNVNVTLLFGLPRYQEVVEAYLAGLESRLAQGGSLARVASVASFFVSRLDTLLDPRLTEALAGEQAPIARAALGQVGIASAKVAFQMFKTLFAQDRFQRLAASGARPQRLLWASTGTKNPADSPVKYVEALIGPGTVDTVPLRTLEAYRELGEPAARLERSVQAARRHLARLVDLGLSLDQATQQLEDEGVEKFIKPFDQLLATLATFQEPPANPHGSPVEASL